ncbi:MAG: S1 RNA-binding domain-containing protein [Candidatus Marsarchaeota archaeon]|nr:S1 RNA-binding domain-containing protein [Candidatus Marsarchaeota archaeon]MCL5102024.1 S1 RNA-binding domain-containing protein [Candidatus Marsarchaeota archaeon]
MEAQKQQRMTPRPGELVIAQVSKIMQFGAYCKLLEYDGIEVFVPIREVSSGWIKNIHEFLHSGQKLVCKITYIDNQKGTIDASIKKVMPKEAKDKLNSYNLEKRFGVLVGKMIKEAGEEKQKDKIASEIVSEFGSYAQLYFDLTQNTDRFASSKLPKKLKTMLSDFIKEQNEKKKHKVSYVLEMVVEDTQNGITEINEALKDAETAGVEVAYISSPKYHISAEGSDYKESEDKIKLAVSKIEQKLKGTEIKVEKEKIRKDKEGIFDSE